MLEKSGGVLNGEWFTAARSNGGVWLIGGVLSGE